VFSIGDIIIRCGVPEDKEEEEAEGRQRVYEWEELIPPHVGSRSRRYVHGRSYIRHLDEW